MESGTEPRFYFECRAKPLPELRVEGGATIVYNIICDTLKLPDVGNITLRNVLGGGGVLSGDEMGHFR